MDLLWIVEVLFFGSGAWYFLKQNQRKKGEGLNFEDNMLEMDRLERLREEKLTEPLSEQTRPQKLEEIIGQDRAVRALRAALCGPNPQHILIYGPPGVGKTAAAWLILEEAKKNAVSPFRETAKFVEIDSPQSYRGLVSPMLTSRVCPAE